jgi:phage terminase small subunit
MPALSDLRHERFARERARGKTLVGAWMLASGMRDRSQASRLGRRPEVAERVRELLAARHAAERRAVDKAAAKFEVTAERVIGELAKLAFANMADYLKIGPDGAPRPDFGRVSRDQAAALQEVTVTPVTYGQGAHAREVSRVRLKLANKRSALVDLGNHLGLFSDPAVQVNSGNIFSDRPPTPEQWEAKLAALRAAAGHG